jgi:hypothetical protein
MATRARSGDDETPGSVGPVDLGAGRTAAAISAGGGHTCAVLDGGDVRCWGFGSDGRALSETPRAHPGPSHRTERTRPLKESDRAELQRPRHGRRKAPAPRAYLVKQSTSPIGDLRAFRRAQTLCNGACRFAPSRVGDTVALKVTDLGPNTTYYYAIAARDNVSRRLGPRLKDGEREGAMTASGLRFPAPSRIAGALSSVQA